MVGLLEDSVHDRVPHVDVGMRHVDFCPEDTLPFGKLTVLHPFEKIEILGNRPSPPGGFDAWLGQGTASPANLFGRLVVDISLSRFDQFEGPQEKLVKIVGGVTKVGPLETEPLHVCLDGFHVLDFLFCRVRVVETEVAIPAEFFCQAKIQADRLGMADMEVTVRFGGKTGDDLADLTGFKVFPYDLLDEVPASCRRFFHVVHPPSLSEWRLHQNPARPQSLIEGFIITLPATQFPYGRKAGFARPTWPRKDRHPPIRGGFSP